MPIFDCCTSRACCPSGDDEPISSNQQLSDDPPSTSLRGCLSSPQVLCVTSCGTTAGATYTGWSIGNLWPLQFVAENAVKYIPPGVVAGLTVVLGALSGVGFFIQCADGRSKASGEQQKLVPEYKSLEDDVITIDDMKKVGETAILHYLKSDPQTQQDIQRNLGYVKSKDD